MKKLLLSLILFPLLAFAATNNSVDVGLSGATGTGSFVGATSPTLTTPTLGAATVTSVNGLTVPSGSSGITAATTGWTSWTPTIAFNGAAVGVTYSAQLGQYWKTCTTSAATSCKVDFFLDLILTSKGSSTGSVSIRSFPVSTGTAGIYNYDCQANNVTQGANLNIFGSMNSSATTSNLNVTGTGATATNLTNTAIANNSEFICYGSYGTN